MNVEMAYLIGMVLGNGEIQRKNKETTITIDIPFKNLYTDDLKDVAIYVKASIVDIRSIVEPLIGHDLVVTEQKHSTKLSFTKANEDYAIQYATIPLVGRTIFEQQKLLYNSLLEWLNNFEAQMSKE